MVAVLTKDHHAAASFYWRHICVIVLKQLVSHEQLDLVLIGAVMFVLNAKDLTLLQYHKYKG